MMRCLVKKSDEERQEAMEKLLTMVKPGDTVETVLRHCSRSRMSWSISPVIYRDGRTIDLSYWAVRLLGYSFDQKNGGLKIGGCGMDMGFALVYAMSRALFPNGFGIEGEMPLGHKIRPTSKKNAAKAVERGAKFRGRNGDTSGWDDDGGYALLHRWI